MPAETSLLSRIRGEYREMPGLRLTARQACCLWHLDPATCDAVLNSLIEEGFLWRTKDGSFVAAAELEPLPVHDIVRRQA